MIFSRHRQRLRSKGLDSWKRLAMPYWYYMVTNYTSRTHFESIYQCNLPINADQFNFFLSKMRRVNNWEKPEKIINKKSNINTKIKIKTLFGEQRIPSKFMMIFREFKTMADSFFCQYTKMIFKEKLLF